MMRKINRIMAAVATTMIIVVGITGCSVSSATLPTTDNTCPALPAPTVITTPVTPAGSKPDRVELIYFHTKNPCHCMAVVGENIKFAVENNFKDEIAAGKVKLTGIVSDDPANAGLVKQYNAVLFVLFIKEIHGSEERMYPVNKIWEMTGDDNRDNLIEFIKTTVTSILEGKS